MTQRLAAKVLTVSDGVVAGTREDRSGAALEERLAAAAWDVVERRVVSDGIEPVAAALREMAAGFAGVVVTTGGTGFAPRDVTPEAIVLNTPGSTAGAVECLDAVLDVLPHALALLTGEPTHH